MSFARHVGAMKKILIVEDNDVVQDILRQFFAPRYNVQIAGNASQALSLIVRVAPDVALLDIKMPGLDGISLLKSLREMGVTVPIFIMTGYDSLQVAQEALNAGANGYLPKPFDLLHLDRLVADACGTDALQPSSVSAR
jgi:DNA-binding NtrC family response regulator